MSVSTFSSEIFFFYILGSISKPIPVTHLQGETLLTTTSAISNQTSISTESPTLSPSFTKAGQKRSAPSGSKEKSNRKKAAKKSTASKFQQNFTANLGTQRAGNLLGNRFASPSSAIKVTGSQTTTLQRLPSGTFVLAGTSGGQMRLQNGNSIVYLQQLTSSGGTTQVIQTPLIANSNGTFSTVPLSSLQQTTSQSNTVTTTSCNIGSPSASQQISSIATASVVETSSNLHLAASLPSFDTKYMQHPNTTTNTTYSSQASQQVQLQNIQTIEEVVTSETSPMSMDVSPQLANPTTTTPPLPSSLANLILSLPSVGASGGFSAEANSQAQSILQKLSEEDIKTLSSLLGRYSSTPSSPASSSPALTPDPERSPLQSPGLSAPSTPSPIDHSLQSSIKATNNNKSEVKLPKSLATSKSQQPIQNVRKISYPLSLTQKVTAIQQDINKMRAPRLKPPRIVTTGLSTNKINISSSATSSSPNVNRTLQSKTQKVPITITIPISRLPSSLQFTTSNSKTINVPALSAYLSQQKFVLSAGKSSTNLDSRTVLLSPNNVKKLGSIMVSTNSNKTTSVFSVKAPHATTSSGSKSSATITLRLPSQSSQKETSTLKKAASDIKLIGVLNQKTKANQLVSASSIKPFSLPSSPIVSPVSLSPTIGELSPIQPRKSDENTMEPIKPVTTTSETSAELIDESDIDFAVIPGDGTSTLLTQRLSNIASTSASSVVGSIASVQKHLTGASKIIRVPVSSGDRRLFGNKNLIELTKPKQLSENLLLNTARKVGVAFQQKSAETKLDKKNSSTDSSIVLESGKLRFEPLNNMVTTSRSNLSSVLSSMRETGKIVMDENGQLRNTIVAKPTVVSSKTAAMIARSAFMTDTKLASKAGISFNPLSKSTVASKTTTPALFSGGMSGNSSSIISTPAATIRTATTSGKVLPVTIKSNDFIRMSSQVRAQQHNTITTKQIIPAKIIKREILKSEMKPKPAKKVVVEPKSPEPPKEEPPPYITRSGRVLRTRFSYSDELDRKPSPRKRKRTISNSKDDVVTPSQTTTLPVAPTTNGMSLLGGSLDSLVEAAKLITTGGASNVASTSPSQPLLDSFHTTDATSTTLSNIDSTTNIAATAMLELLSSDTTGLMQPLPLVAETDNAQKVMPVLFSSEKELVTPQPIEHQQPSPNNESDVSTLPLTKTNPAIEFVGNEEPHTIQSAADQVAPTKSYKTAELKFVNEEAIHTSDSTLATTLVDVVQQEQQQFAVISSSGNGGNGETIIDVKQVEKENGKVLHSVSSSSQVSQAVITEKEIEISTEKLLQEE